jgi:hypothetical protein
MLLLRWSSLNGVCDPTSRRPLPAGLWRTIRLLQVTCLKLCCARRQSRNLQSTQEHVAYLVRCNLAGLAVAGVIAGLILRVRTYLYLGTIALLFDLGVNLFRLGTQDTLTGTAILCVLGASCSPPASPTTSAEKRFELDSLESVARSMNGNEATGGGSRAACHPPCIPLR